MKRVFLLLIVFCTMGLIDYVQPPQNLTVSWLFAEGTNLTFISAADPAIFPNISVLYSNASAQESEISNLLLLSLNMNTSLSLQGANISLLWQNISGLGVFNSSFLDADVSDIYANLSNVSVREAGFDNSFYGNGLFHIAIANEVSALENNNIWNFTNNQIILNKNFNQMIIKSSNDSLVIGQSIQIGLLPINGVPSNVSPSGLIGGWHFDESSGDFADFSGYGDTLVSKVNTFTYGQSAVFSKGVYGDSTSKSNVSAVNLSPKNVTVSFWFLKNPTQAFTNSKNIVANVIQGTSAYSAYGCYFYNNRIYFTSGLGDIGSVSIAGLSNNTWHNFAVSYVNSTKNYTSYLDGSIIESKTGAYYMNITSGSVFSFSADNSNGRYGVNSTIDELLIFNRELSPSEISGLYTDGIHYQAITSFPYFAPQNNKVIDLGLYNQSWREAYADDWISTPPKIKVKESKYATYQAAVKDIPFNSSSGLTDFNSVPKMFRDSEGHNDTISLYAYVTALREVIFEQDARITALEKKK